MPCSLPNGWYCPSASATSQSGAPCPPGFYCTEGVKKPCEAAEGYVCAGRDEEKGGSKCPTGYYCAGGKTQALPCTAPVGFFCDRGTSSDVDFTVCPENYMCQGGSTAPLLCPESTPTGSYCASGKSSVQDCPSGYYCAAGIKQLCVAPPGFYCAVKERNRNGTVCKAGQYCIGGAYLPRDCEQGYYNPVEGASKCLLCPEDSICASPGTITPVKLTSGEPVISLSDPETGMSTTTLGIGIGFGVVCIIIVIGLWYVRKSRRVLTISQKPVMKSRHSRND